MADNARGIHVSPGIYTREYELTYAIRSLGITTLGLVGETLKGPAFEPMGVSNWREFQSMFGGTSTEKYKGSQYPKYELPYIAKSYLSESQQLNVVRVLGLSGYNAGPAWVVTASNGSGSTKQAVAVLRSRGSYNPYKAASTTADCICETSRYDTLSYSVGELIPDSGETTDKPCVKLGYNVKALALKPYVPLSSSGDICNGFKYGTGEENTNEDDSVVYVSQTDKGRFKIVGVTCPTKEAFDMNRFDDYEALKNHDWYKKYAPSYFEYAVSLNPYDKEYILNVLGTTPSDGTAPIYVESLYDVALEQGIAEGDIDQIDLTLQGYNAYYTADYCHHEPIYGLMTVPMSSLNRRHVGQRVLADKAAVDAQIKCVPYNYETGMPYMYSEREATAENQKPENLTGDALEKWKKTTPAEETVKCGQIYTVRQYTTQAGKREYFYAYYTKESVAEAFDVSGDTNSNLDLTNYYGNLLNGGTEGNQGIDSTLVLNNADGLYYRMNDDKTDIHYVELDMNDYRSAYRYASTPWIVSNLKGDIKNVTMSRLFRFHTISDGDNANKEIKISIENIDPDNGTFDVLVRRIDDTDESIVVLERFGKCTMTPGDSNYIAYQIGSFDGVYESKSQYITVEVNEDTAAQMSVPAGFLGYPIPKYNGTPISGEANDDVEFPSIKYNTTYDETVKARKQYFGLSSWVGVDVDTFTFKGTKAYIDRPEFLSHGFHLDSRLDSGASGVPQSAITVDGESGYEFDCVSTQSRTQSYDQPPVIGTEEEMYGSIFENKTLRKFTLFFYGGFDGWDVYRSERTNTDDYTVSQYKGYVGQGSGEGYSFNKIKDPSLLGLTENGITSDYYAYLSGIRKFANPEAVDINVFATPGIDYVNQTSLVEEAIEMIETERADSIYVVTTPDKPSGAGDTVDDMYTPDDAVNNLLDTEIDSNYTCTYYPWIKYLDQDNSQYIFLPPTKDVVRNFAQTDNTSYPWFAPAGIGRGNVDCVGAKYITKLTDEDTLYEGRINPIKTFAQDGPKVWGQKNLQVDEGQLNRIAVRRLLLRMRKLISIACIGLIFEPNDATTKQSFLSTVTPILDNIKSNRGISDYRIEVNDSVESRQRRELPVIIYFKPYNALEYITIDFVVSPEGVSFDDI